MREAGPLVFQFKDKVDGIFAPNESSASGMADVLRSQGLNKKVLLMGFDSSKPLLQAIGEGDVVGSILQDPYRMGYLGVWCCVRHLLGEHVNAGGKDMELSTGEFLVTKENVTAESTLGLFDLEHQKKRVMDKPRFPRRAPTRRSQSLIDWRRNSNNSCPNGRNALPRRPRVGVEKFVG